MEETEMAYFRIPADAEYPFDRLGNFRIGHEPKGAIQISEDEARLLHDETTARTPAKQRKTVESEPTAAPVDLSDVYARLDAVTAQVERVEGAMNDMTAGLTGEKLGGEE
jgi:hypothetical protein